MDKKLVDEIYNYEWKNEFLYSTYDNEKTRDGIIYDFKKSARLEKLLDKDLSFFNTNEIDDLAKSLNPSTENSLRRMLTYFQNYTDWCMDRGLRGEYENGINDYRNFIGTQDLGVYVSNIKFVNQFITKQQLGEIRRILINPMDAAIIQALWEGISGEGLHEIRSIDINVNLKGNKLKVFDKDGSSRDVIISNELAKLLHEADNEHEYILENGQGKRGQKRVLEDSNFVFKTMKNKNSCENEMLDYKLLVNKMTALKRYTGYHFITPKSIVSSGAMYKVEKWAKDAGLSEPTIEIFHKLHDPSSYNMTTSQTVKLREKYDELKKRR
jgi:hypothetical protein